MAKFKDSQGNPHEVEVNLETVRAAADQRLSVRDLINGQYDTNAEAYGDAFAQMCESEGIVLNTNRTYGIRAGSLDSVLNGRPTINAAGAIVKNPSSQARILLMPAIGALVEDKLLGNLDESSNAFDSMIALDDTIADDWLLWPEVNYSGPESGRSQPIAQLAKPVNMLTLTTSEKQIRIPTFSMGVEWSEQATKFLNLDFITLSIARQVMIERNARANENLLAMLNGDADVGQGSLSSVGKVTTAVSLDATASTGITQKAWMLWLYKNSKKRKLTHLVTDIAGAMAIEGRANRPTVQGDNPTSTRIDTITTISNPSWAAELPIYVVDPSVGWPAGTVMGLDSQYAIQRITSTNASYQAQEDFVLRRGSAMRFDAGSLSRRLYNDAFEVLTYTP